MLVCYSDESWDNRAFVVSGLLGYLPEWVELERLWRTMLDKQHLPEFHAAKCEIPREPFERYEREVRDLFQREFYGLICNLQLWGFCTAVWHADYKERWSEFEEHRRHAVGDFTHPYFLAFQHNIELMCLNLDRAGVPRNEPIAFVFDQQQEFEGRAKLLYESLRRSKGGGITYRNRLGRISFESRLCVPQLQAADVWAYESRKYVTDMLIDNRPDRARWQYGLLEETKRMNIKGFPPESLDRLAVVVRELASAPRTLPPAPMLP
jgi:hypothetical protein